MKRIKTFGATLVLALLTSSQALAGPTGNSSDDGGVVLLGLLIVFGGLIALAFILTRRT